jgi:hypothetical protein
LFVMRANPKKGAVKRQDEASPLGSLLVMQLG